MTNKSSLLLLALLATTFAQPAFAKDAEKDGFDVTLGGYFKGYGNYTDQDNTGTGVREVDILRRTEVHFNAEKEMENGTTFGVHVEGLADQGSSFDIDESLMYVEGKWGQVNFGAKDGAAFLLQVAAPSADKDVDGVRQQINPVNLSVFPAGVGETDYDQNISAKADKITYITPLYEGFQAGISYTPEVEASRGGNGNSLDGDDTTANSDVVDVALRYQKKFDDFKITAGAGFTHAEREAGAGDDSRKAWNAALALGFKGFNVGVAYQNDDEGTLESDDVEYLSVGIDYKWDKFLVGASYFNKNDEIGTEIDTDRYTAGITYSYAPGVAFRSSVSHLTSDFDAGEKYDATSFLLGTIIDF